MHVVGLQDQRVRPRASTAITAVYQGVRVRRRDGIDQRADGAINVDRDRKGWCLPQGEQQCQPAQRGVPVPLQVSPYTPGQGP
jgi:hypothetical protein